MYQLVAVFGGVGEFPGAHGVQHDHAGSRHPAILRRMVTNVLGVLGVLVFCACVIVLAAAATWAVVKISPSKAKKETAATEG